MLEGLYSPEYDMQDFIAAFYELANIEALGALHPKTAAVGGSEISPELIRIC